MSDGTVQEFRYRLDAPASGRMPGAHRSRRGDGGVEFRGHVPLRDAPDPRRLDLRASLRDPLGDWQVRVHSERLALPVVLVADLSASMGFEGRHRRLDVLADFVQSLGRSAWRSGDRFGFVGAAEAVLADWVRPPARSRDAGPALAQALRALVPEGGGAGGLADAHRFLGRQRALVFLASDFHWPIEALDAVLAALARHDLVPVVLWDPLEFGPAAARGLLQAVDPESGRRRLVWWGAASRRAAVERRAARLDLLGRRFRAHGRRPLLVEGGFEADAVTRHFVG